MLITDTIQSDLIMRLRGNEPAMHTCSAEGQLYSTVCKTENNPENLFVQISIFQLNKKQAIETPIFCER